MRSLPKPLQRPHPPIIMGGGGAKALECAVAECDGWAPWLLPSERTREMIAELHRLAAEGGRDPSNSKFGRVQVYRLSHSAAFDGSGAGIRHGGSK